VKPLKLTPATKIVVDGFSMLFSLSIVSAFFAFVAAASTKKLAAPHGAARRGAAARSALPVKEEAPSRLLQLARAPQRAPAALDVAIFAAGRRVAAGLWMTWQEMAGMRRRGG
jgi:hypothetical protein